MPKISGYSLKGVSYEGNGLGNDSIIEQRNEMEFPLIDVFGRTGDWGFPVVQSDQRWVVVNTSDLISRLPRKMLRQ